MPKADQIRKQISVALSDAQTDWCNTQARRRGISTAEFVRRLIDGMMLGDNTMSRGVDWQPAMIDPIASTPLRPGTAMKEHQRALLEQSRQGSTVPVGTGVTGSVVEPGDKIDPHSRYGFDAEGRLVLIGPEDTTQSR